MKLLHQKIYFNLGLFILSALLLICLVILPLLNKIKNSSNELSKQNLIIDELYKKWLDLKVSQKNLEKIDLNQIEKPLLNSEESLDFILALENIAKKAELEQEIRTFSLSSPTTEQKFKTIPFQIVLWGTFPNLMRFLVYFENMPFYAEITSIHINRLDARSLITEKMPNLKEGDIKAILNIEVYTQ